jgi:hypothetical protein
VSAVQGDGIYTKAFAEWSVKNLGILRIFFLKDDR